MDTSDVRSIADLAEAIRNAAPVQKDPEAAQLIGQLIGSQPDALYFLVQTVLVQKEALAAQAQGPGMAPPAAPAGAAASAGPAGTQETRPRWGGLFGSRRTAPEGAPAPASDGGSFLKTAAAGAAGVAGGVLLAQGISGLFAPPAGEHAAADEPGWDDDGDWGEA